MPEQAKAFVWTNRATSPMRGFFMLLTLHLHYTLVAIEYKAETLAVGREKVERLLVTMSLAILAAPPHALLDAMLAEHERCTFGLPEFKSRCYLFIEE